MISTIMIEVLFFGYSYYGYFSWLIFWHPSSKYELSLTNYSNWWIVKIK